VETLVTAVTSVVNVFGSGNEQGICLQPPRGWEQKSLQASRLMSQPCSLAKEFVVGVGVGRSFDKD
jgi:hypothetical protein